MFLGELKRYVRYNTEKIKKKTQMLIFHTVLQKDKLLNTELPLPNVCEPLTIQEAKTRIILDGEAAYSLSQGDEATSDPLDFNPAPSSTQPTASTATAKSPKGTRGFLATI